MIRKFIKKNIPFRIFLCYTRIKNIITHRDSNKIFCLSVQKTGTTSIGNFFQYFGYRRCGWPCSEKNEWSEKWLDGNFEAIFNSKDFKLNQVFEDSPFWFPEFYKVLYHRFPKAKFILFTRDSQLWFNSLVTHYNRRLDKRNKKLHCKLYRREKEYYDIKATDSYLKSPDNMNRNRLAFNDFDSHYKSIYEIRNREIIDFFKEKDPSRLVVCSLEDPNKWKVLGDFFNIKVPENFNVHENKTKS